MLYVLILLFSLLVGNVHAAPSITGVSGTISHGNTITITGSGFGIKSPVAPQVWSDFTGGLAVSPLSLSSSLYAQSVSVTTSYPSTGYAPYAAAVVGTTFGAGTSEIGAYAPTIGTGWTKLYNYVKRYWNFPVTNSQKSWRMYTADSGTDTRDVIQTNAPWGRIYTENSGDIASSNYYGDYSGNQLSGSGGSSQGSRGAANTWNVEEFLWDYGTGGADGIWYNFLNGVQNQYRNGMTNGTGSSYYANPIISNYCTPGSGDAPGGAAVYMSDYYIDTTYARVMISDTPSFGMNQTTTSSHREIQIPKTQWLDGQLQIQVNQGSFANGANAYLYVIDANNTVSAPYFITFGGSPSVVNGACGSASGGSFTSVPSTNLCSTGSATTVSGAGPWAWGCNGSGGGTDTANNACNASLTSQASSAYIHIMPNGIKYPLRAR
jgi:hypothetical protein